MNNLWQTITDWDGQQETIRQRRYGIIETVAGKFVAIHFRPWPKLLSWPEIMPVGSTYHARGKEDRCLLYFNQPRGHSNFLALKYVVSTPNTTRATIFAALAILDAVAKTKGTDAILCDAFNQRLSDRMLNRHGWESHKPQRWHRNFIKRFYGVYPTIKLPEFASPQITN